MFYQNKKEQKYIMVNFNKPPEQETPSTQESHDLGHTAVEGLHIDVDDISSPYPVHVGTAQHEQSVHIDEASELPGYVQDDRAANFDLHDQT